MSIYQSCESSRSSGVAIPTIAFLTESLNSRYQSQIWMGACDMAHLIGYSLQCFAGGSLYTSPWNQYESQRNIIYRFLDKTSIAGMVIAGSLGNFISEEEFEAFYKQFTEIPIVCIGPQLPNIPTIITDNSNGMRQLIAHLVEVHGCKNIAFVRGPEGNQEAEKRLTIFMEVLVEHGIVPNESIIIKGDFSRNAGVNAVEYLLTNGCLFDAVVGANDDTALGALHALQNNHMHVPEDVQVCGFDDIDECSYSSPSLTTIKQPLYEIGEKAIAILHSSIEGKHIDGTIKIPATLVVRHSCGCHRTSTVKSSFAVTDGDQSLEEQKKVLFIEVNTIIERTLIASDYQIKSSEIEELVESFVNECCSNTRNRFLHNVKKITLKIAENGGDTIQLYQVLAVMRRFVSAVCSTGVSEYVDQLFQNGYSVILETVTMVQANRRLWSENKEATLRNAGQAIASAFDLDDLEHVITEQLTTLEIDECYIALYNQDNVNESKLSLQLILSIQNGVQDDIWKEIIFDAPQFLPDTIALNTMRHSLLIEPLHFNEEQIGIIIFSVKKCRDGVTYEILQQHISSALKGAILMKKVREQKEALEHAHLQLKALRDSEHAYLEAVKRELKLGRDIQNSFLPRKIPEIENWEIETVFEPAREVSGDFYDIFQLPDGRLIVLICDVSGKDVSAALYAALIRTLLRALAEQVLTGAFHPLDSVQITNQYLINHHYSSNGRQMYATLFMAMVDPLSGAIEYINAGHNPPCIISKNGIRRWIFKTGPAVGLIPGGVYTAKKCVCTSEEVLFLYTDGVTEARSPDGSLFSKGRLTDLLNAGNDSALHMVENIHREVQKHTACEHPSDDITMIALKNKNAEMVRLQLHSAVEHEVY